MCDAAGLPEPQKGMVYQIWSLQATTNTYLYWFVV
jgi:hypothetical protein